MSNDAVLEKQREEDVINEREDVMYEQEEEQLKENLVKDTIQAIERTKKMGESNENKDADKKITVFLHKKNLSVTLIKTMIDSGLTSEKVRFLKALDLTDNDVDTLRDLWQTKIEKVSKTSDSINSTSPDDSSSSAHLSPNSVYLKKVLSKPLIQALREIAMKKPADPVEYLGHWLLHYKICEERNIQKEREVELLINQEKLKLKEVEKALSVERKEEEALDEDLNYLNYTKEEK